MKSISVQLRVYVDAKLAVGPGRIELLERMNAAGSLARAAREMGMSYRRAWQLMHSLNASLDKPAFVATKGGRNGGGAVLTATGLSLVRAYRRTEADCLRRVRRDLGRFARL